MSFLVLIAVFLNVIERGASYIPIGGIFASPNQDNEIAFRVAVDMVNERNMLPQDTLSPLIVNIDPEDVVDEDRSVIGITWDRPLTALEAACSVLNAGVVGVITPLWEDNASAVQSVCDTKEIPIIRTEENEEEKLDCCAINMFPSILSLARAFADLVERWNWKSFTIIYDYDDSFLHISELLKLYNTSDRIVILEHLYKSETGDYRKALKDIRKSGQRNFVLHCDTENLEEILQQLQQVGLMTKKFSYIVANVDLRTIDLTPYQNSEANITSLQLVDPTKPAIIQIAQAMQDKRKELGLQLHTLDSDVAATKLQSTAILTVDAVMLFAETLKDIGYFTVEPLFCNASGSWEHGSTLFNFMKMKPLESLTGLMEFDSHGVRSDFALDVVELQEKGIAKIGKWDSKEGLTISRTYPKNGSGDVLWNETVRVLICWSEPYALYKNRTTTLKGNEQYEGFVIDLMEKIAELEGFNYSLIRNPDDKNGDFNETTKTWNGMIGDILDDRGDIAIGDLSITRKREEYVDFTTPFMSSGIQILYKKPERPMPLFFSFAGPFSPKVWLLIGVSYFAVSFILYIISRFSHPEWDNLDPCIQHPKYYVNQMNAKNSLWYMLGCLMQEGAADLAPRSASTRVLSGVWAFFILVIVSYYKAQLAASLTVEFKDIPFKDAEELIDKADMLGIRYGATANEVTHTFFKESPVPFHQKIAAHMEAHPEQMVTDNYEGYLKIEEGDYAYFTESVFAQFVTNIVCYLTTVGNPINEQHFAIAVKKNSPYRGPLSKAILKLMETGVVGTLQTKWWNERFIIEDCKKLEGDASATLPLNYHHVAGIFWITFGGILIAFVLVFIELAIHILYKCKGDYRAFKEEFKEELRFYFSFKCMVKPMKDGKIATLSERRQNDTASQH